VAGASLSLSFSFSSAGWPWWRRSGKLTCFVSQARVRSPWLDAYFLQTSMLGTHTFFLVFLPAFFFFGYDDLGRG